MPMLMPLTEPEIQRIVDYLADTAVSRERFEVEVQMAILEPLDVYRNKNKGIKLYPETRRAFARGYIEAAKQRIPPC